MDNRRPVDYQLRPSRDLTILIPARAGSKRIPHKNTRLLGGKPLIQWTIDEARTANVACVVVSTDEELTAELAERCGCEVHHRKPEHATDEAPDYGWVSDIDIQTPYFAICRPTSPFRTAGTIRRAYATLLGCGAHSVRAVTRVTAPHPAKMWMIRDGRMLPVWDGRHPDGTPYHSSPTQSLPEVWVQNASLEVAQTRIVRESATISGWEIAPFFTDAREGFDLNTEADWLEAERLVGA
jgi:N-acylneuraminate cytidylyltransferase